MTLDESAGPHGVPWSDALDPENDGWFEVEEHVDFAQAALDEWHRTHDSKDVEPGTRLVVVNARRSDGLDDDEHDDDGP